MASNPWQPPENCLPGRYSHIRLGRRIGKGGFGLVFLASSPDHPDLSLCVKFLNRPDWKHDPREIGLFLKETQRLQRLTHDHLARCWQFCDLRPDVSAGWLPLALVMTCYLPSLEEVLHYCAGRPVLPARLVAEWARQLAEVVKYLHEHKHGPLAHRDIKPGNILLELIPGALFTGTNFACLKDSSIKLTDLGVSALLDVEPPYHLGQDGWKAPELFDGAGRPIGGKVQAAQDIYALGLVLKKLVPCVPGKQVWLDEIVAACLDRDLAARPTAAALLRSLATIDWDAQTQLLQPVHVPSSTDELRRAGWRPEEHADLVGRDFVFEAFAKFTSQRAAQGGVFVLEAIAGIGKTSLLTHWAGQTAKAGESAAGFYYRYRDRRVRAAAIPAALWSQLGRQYNLPIDPVPSEDEFAACLEERLRVIAATQLRGRRLFLFVDALDEADDPARAAAFLPRTLPEGVYVIASTRPPLSDRDHLAGLKAAGACIFPLQADGDDNLRDLARFFRQRLGEENLQGAAEDLARATGGSFLLATLLTEAVERKTLTVSDAVRQAHRWVDVPPGERLFEYYKESWERAALLVDEDCLTEFATLLTAAENWLSDRQMLDLLRWYETESLHRSPKWDGRTFKRSQIALNWLLATRTWEQGEADFLRLRHLSSREFLLGIRHQSMREYLVDGPARFGLNAMHAAIGDCYRVQAGERGWRQVEPYGRCYAVSHLWQADDPAHQVAAAAVLADLDYLQATLGDGAGY